MNRRGYSRIESSMGYVKSRLPVVKQTLDSFGTSSIGDYLESMQTVPHPGLQDRSDLLGLMAESTERILGTGVADNLLSDLNAQPAVLTANHHGLDTFAQSIQTNLMFSMRRRPDGGEVLTIPVLACSNIPINNLTYPRGLLVYGADQENNRAGPLKLPIFSDRFKRRMVNQITGIDAGMLKRVSGRVSALAGKGVLNKDLSKTLHRVLDEDFNEVVNRELPDYSDQATLLNNLLWRRLYQQQPPPVDLVYLDLERIVGKILAIDLNNSQSLAYRLMFDTSVRNSLIEELDGERGCWSKDLLDASCSNQSKVVGNGAGTIFYWGMDDSGRRVPLTIREDNSGSVSLYGITDKGAAWQMPFCPDAILRGIREGHLQPSLFTCYLVVSLARGVACVGGYYQAEYLPVMQNGVCAALRKNDQFVVAIGPISEVATDLYLSGMQLISMDTPGGLKPAGLFEISARGGLTTAELDRIRRINLYDAHIASISDTLVDIDPSWSSSNTCPVELFQDISSHAEEKICLINWYNG